VIKQVTVRPADSSPGCPELSCSKRSVLQLKATRCRIDLSLNRTRFLIEHSTTASFAEYNEPTNWCDHAGVIVIDHPYALAQIPFSVVVQLFAYLNQGG
jgi:hypothetical protein